MQIVESPIQECQTDAIEPVNNNTIIANAIPLNPGESLRICPVTAQCFRVNVWKNVTTDDCILTESRIERSYFVTIREGQAYF
jgi:hypothetical protein